MTDAVSKLSTFLQNQTEENYRDAFYLFEPWDVEERPDWVKEMAKEDGIELDGQDTINMYGKAPHAFQTGMMTSDAPIAVSFAANRVGKSYGAVMLAIILTTGELPYAFRYEKGEDTGIKRDINSGNIERFGRFDSETGEFIDHDTSAIEDGTWDCGNIVGVGRFPKELIIPRNAETKRLWICTKGQAFESFWWPKFQELIPEHLLDASKGTGGFSHVRDKKIYLHGGFEIKVLTYDQGKMAFEAIEVPYAFIDEEAPQPVYAAILFHADRVRIFETPYDGVTWSYHDLLIPSMREGSRVEVFHATAFDSPYITEDKARVRRDNVKRWEVKARIWGFHCDNEGKPWYEHHHKYLTKLAVNAVDVSEKAEFVPTKQVSTYKDIATVPIMKVEYGGEHERGEWEVYEDRVDGVAYWLSADTAEGSEDEAQAAADRSAAFIFRKPKANENQEFPVCVAACRSTRSTLVFTRSCVYAAAYYNMALLAPEVRGETGAVFATEAREYPYLYKMTVTNNRTKKQTQKVGYITSPRTRQILFDNMDDLLNTYKDSTTPPFTYKPLIKELQTCVVAKGGRPDHTKHGTTDSIVAYGVGIYVYKVDKEQIRYVPTVKARPERERKAWYEDRGHGSKDNKPNAVFKRRR